MTVMMVVIRLLMMKTVVIVMTVMAIMTERTKRRGRSQERTVLCKALFPDQSVTRKDHSSLFLAH